MPDPLDYLEIVISDGPGIMPVHVVVPQEAGHEMCGWMCTYWTEDGLHNNTVIEPVPRSRFLEWAETA